MINLQNLRQQIQNQLQTNFESNQFYYQNQNPQVPNGFIPIDQINNFDQEKDRLKTQQTTPNYIDGSYWGIVGSHTETRYRSVERTRSVPVYSKIVEKWCKKGDHKLEFVFYDAEEAWEFEMWAGSRNLWCDICRCSVDWWLKPNGQEEYVEDREEKYTVQEPYQETISDYGNIPTRVQNGTTTNWNAVKQALEQQFTPPNQNEYSFIYLNANDPGEPDLAQIYQSADGRQYKIVLKGTAGNQNEFNNWIQNVRQRINNRNNTVESLFTQYAQEAERQANELRQTRREFLSQKIDIKKEKLEKFIQQLGVNREQVRNLRNAYEQLIHFRRQDYNQTGLSETRNNIETIEQEFLEGGISLANAKKIGRKCEKIAELKWEASQINQQQFEARQGVPPRNS